MAVYLEHPTPPLDPPPARLLSTLDLQVLFSPAKLSREGDSTPLSSFCDMMILHGLGHPISRIR